MNILVIGGTGFIGYRLVRLLAAQGHGVTCMDANPTAHSFADLGDRVVSLHGDVNRFEDVHAAMDASQPERVVNLAYLIVGVVVIEVVFVYPGVGQYMVDGVSKRDLPVVQACGLIFAGAFVGLNTIADVLAILVNPRLRNPR